MIRGIDNISERCRWYAMTQDTVIGRQRVIARFLVTINTIADDKIVVDQENIYPARWKFVMTGDTFIDYGYMIG